MTSNDVTNAQSASLMGWIENPSPSSSNDESENNATPSGGNGNEEGGSGSTHTLKEVIVTSNPPSITVYNIKEYGRRHLRTLEYTSNQTLCLHEVESEPYPDRVGGVLAMSGGVPMTTSKPEASLLITRALNSEMGTQTYLPKRFLAGLVPSSLIDKYIFWQNEDDSIVGYEMQDLKDEGEITEEFDDIDADVEDAHADGTDSHKAAISTKSSTRLLITLQTSGPADPTGFCNTSASALVQRLSLRDSDEESLNVDPNRKTLTLLNVNEAPSESLLKQIGMLLSRLDNLSHVLVWSETSVSSTHLDANSIDVECSIDLIELPRVNLSFRSKFISNIDGSSEWRLYSNDNDGLYVATSSVARKMVQKLLGSIDHFIVLQNEDGDLFVLMPGCALPRRLHTDSSHLSVQVLLDRRNSEWIANMGEIRTYLFPIHPSQSFLITPSLASSMYLMVMYFIVGLYGEVYKMIESCVSEELTAEEIQIWNQLEFLGRDVHPDAHAVRLKLSAVTVGLEGTEGGKGMKCFWSVYEEMR